MSRSMMVEILRRHDHANGRRQAAGNSVMPAQAGIQGWESDGNEDGYRPAPV